MLGDGSPSIRPSGKIQACSAARVVALPVEGKPRSKYAPAQETTGAALVPVPLELTRGTKPKRGESTMPAEKTAVTCWGEHDDVVVAEHTGGGELGATVEVKFVSINPDRHESKSAQSRPVPFGESSGTVACDPLIEPPGASTSQ